MPSEPYDAALVLGAAVAADGGPSPAMDRRVRHAVALWHAGIVGHLVMTGGIVRRPPAEADLMGQLAQAQGVPSAALVLERHALNTIDNARLCRRIVAERGWRRVLVVTDSFHLPRALYAFRRFGVAADGSPAPRGASRLDWYGAWARELPARLVYLWRVGRAVRRGDG